MPHQLERLILNLDTFLQQPVRRLPVARISSAPAACSASQEWLYTSLWTGETPARFLPSWGPGLIRHGAQLLSLP
jgi:hypothetical protein